MRQVTLGDEEIPVDEIGRMLIDFVGAAWHLSRVFDCRPHRPSRAAPAAVAGKIVLVGLTAHALGDRKVTPVSGDFPGVEIHANAIDNVLRGDFVRRSRVEGTAEEEAVALVLVLAIRRGRGLSLACYGRRRVALWVTSAFRHTRSIAWSTTAC